FLERWVAGGSALRAKRAEGGAQLGAEPLWLFPGGEVPALVHFVEVVQRRIGAFGPGPGRAVDFAREHRDRHRYADLGRLLRGSAEIVVVVFPVEPPGRRGGAGQPVQADVV